MNFLEVLQASRIEDGNYIIREVSFNLQRSRKIAISGATGSGKTTLLKLIAGLLPVSEGIILFEGKKVPGPHEVLLPGHPRISYLSQQFELRNHYRVEEILSMANKLSNEEAGIIYNVCRISHLLNRWTHQLSGGEKQRIALARLLVAAPRLLLLDEPFSNLDVFHKNILKEAIDEVCETLNITCLLISHDPQDTLSWADEIIILQNGRIIQQDVPEVIYRHPVTEYSAALFGKYTLLTPALAKAFSVFTDIEMNTINSFLRPEDFKVAHPGKGLACKINKVFFLGRYYEAEVVVLKHTITVNIGLQRIAEGDVIYVSLHPGV